MASIESPVSATVRVDEVRVDNPRSLGELFSSASKDMSTLVRAEIELAKSEIKMDLRQAAKGGGAFGAAAFLGFFAFPLLSVAAVYGIHATGLGLAWSFLVIGGFYALLAGALALVGLKAVKKVRPPRRTIRTAQDTVTTFKSIGQNGRH
jgi:hypothetical protein